MPVWKMEKVAKQMAKEGDADAAKWVELGKKKNLSLQENRKFGESSKKIGFLKHVGVEQMVNRMKRQMADEEKAVETNVSPVAFRKENIQQPVVGTAGEKSKPMTSIAQINPAKSSALAGRENIAKGKAASVSISRATQPKETSEKKEEKPVAVDLMID